MVEDDYDKDNCENKIDDNDNDDKSENDNDDLSGGNEEKDNKIMIRITM